MNVYANFRNFPLRISLRHFLKTVTTRTRRTTVAGLRDAFRRPKNAILIQKTSLYIRKIIITSYAYGVGLYHSKYTP